jgi:hypothetical protein
MGRKLTQFEGEKALFEARKRDVLRSKVPEGRRLEAAERGQQITEEHSRANGRLKDTDESEIREKVYDSAMKTAYNGVKKEMEIRRLIL